MSQKNPVSSVHPCQAPLLHVKHRTSCCLFVVSSTGKNYELRKLQFTDSVSRLSGRLQVICCPWEKSKWASEKVTANLSIRRRPREAVSSQGTVHEEQRLGMDLLRVTQPAEDSAPPPAGCPPLPHLQGLGSLAGPAPGALSEAGNAAALRQRCGGCVPPIFAPLL